MPWSEKDSRDLRRLADKLDAEKQATYSDDTSCLESFLMLAVPLAFVMLVALYPPLTKVATSILPAIFTWIFDLLTKTG